MGTKRHGVHFSQYRDNENSAFLDLSDSEVLKIWHHYLSQGIHGICFSLYEEGQAPGDIISEEQVRRRMAILKPYVGWVRSFSCTEGNEHIPIIAKEMGIKTLVGAWLGDDPEINEREVEGLIELAKEGYVDVAAVGNEVLYRKELTEQELLEFIYRVKEQIPNIPVGYVDAYYEFSERPAVAEACDVILCNCYPFWEGCPFEYSLAHLKSMYYQALEAGQGKKVIITETGWPNKGEPFEGSVPSMEFALQYFVQFQKWVAEQEIESFYFSSFDESWKKGAEGEVGAYWGLWDSKEKLKY